VEDSPMPTLALVDAEPQMTVDDFQALEQRVLRTVQMLKTEREQRVAAETRAAAAEERAHDAEERSGESGAVLAGMEAELASLRKERDAIRTKVERLLGMLDDLAI
jgi:hypothetical protein